MQRLRPLCGGVGQNPFRPSLRAWMAGVRKCLVHLNQGVGHELIVVGRVPGKDPRGRALLHRLKRPVPGGHIHEGRWTLRPGRPGGQRHDRERYRTPPHRPRLLSCIVLLPGCRRSEAAEWQRSEEHTSELQSPCNLVCRLLLEKKKKNKDTVRKPWQTVIK